MIISLTNQKGGSARSTTAFNVGAILAAQGHKTLLVDLDPQGTLSSFYGVDSGGMDGVILDMEPIAGILAPVRPNLDIAPTTIHLASAEFKLPTLFNREYRLKMALEKIKSQYEFILIDNQPSLGLLFVNSLAAADAVLIVMATDYASLLGVRLLYESIQSIRAQVNPSLKIMGLVRTRYDGRTSHARQVSEKAVEMFTPYFPILDTVISERTAVRDSSLYHQPITEFEPTNQAAIDYTNLATEITNYGKSKA